MFYPEDNTKAIIATEMGVYETALINGTLTSWTGILLFLLSARICFSTAAAMEQ